MVDATATGLRFLLDGEEHDAGALPPTTTVLEYLRDHLGRCGTREGCAEGDCGACTVVVAELDGEGLRYRARNSCIQFLPTLDGKALLTVESLKKQCGGVLHPAQKAMVESHGSQCGFCTPGFVMSLYALYRNDRSPDAAAVRFALAGNLCRCTGYRPILAAAERMYELDDATDPAFEQDMRAGLKSLRSATTAAAESQPAGYFAPRTIEDLLDKLAQQPGATILAGGTDVGLWVTKQYRDLGTIIYLGQVDGLDQVTRTNDAIEIGATVSLTDAFAALLSEHPGLAEIVRRFASPPVCNAGTLCGNVANGSPIGDSMPALIALGAEVILLGRAGERAMALEDFYLGYQQKDLREGEFVRSVRVPNAVAGAWLRAYKIAKRFDQDISAVCAAFAVQVSGGKVSTVRVAFGGMAATPQRAPACEQALLGQGWNEATIERAASVLVSEYQPLSDVRASSAYRAEVAANLLRRFYAEVTDDSLPQRVWDVSGVLP